jgi:hypothetical protein
LTFEIKVSEFGYDCGQSSGIQFLPLHHI